MVSLNTDEAAREDIALAVQRALDQHGYERLTTAKIADEYENSEAGLYYYFDTKDEMIAAFLDHAADYLSEDLLRVEADDPEAALRDACEFLFRTPEHEYAGIAVAIMELLSHAPYNETLRGPLLELETACLDALTNITAAGVDQGVFRDVDPRSTATFLLAAADGSTGIAVALEMDVAEDLRQGWTAYVDSLLAESAG